MKHKRRSRNIGKKPSVGPNKTRKTKKKPIEWGESDQDGPSKLATLYLQYKENNPPRTKYGIYINSPEWKMKRLSILAERGRQCSICKSWTAKTIDLHHLSYERLGNELPEDLAVVCRDCHQGVHKKYI